MPKFPKGFGRRKSTANAFEDIGSNRGSNASNTNTASTTNNSSRLSAASTAPSSADMYEREEWKSPHDKPFSDIPLPLVPKSSSAFNLKNAGRTLSWGRNKPTPPIPDKESPSLTIEETPQQINRSRAVTTSSYASTATLPKLKDRDLVGLSLGGFSEMFSGFGKRKSVVMDAENNRVMSQSPDTLPSGPANRSNRLNPPSALNIDRNKEVEASPYSWSSQHSRDRLMSSSSPPPPPPVPQRGARANTDYPASFARQRPDGLANTGLRRSSAVMEPKRQSTLEYGESVDEDAKLLKESVSASRQLDDPGHRARDSWLLPSTYSYKVDDSTLSSWRTPSTETTPRAKKAESKPSENNLFDTQIVAAANIANHYQMKSYSPPARNAPPQNKVMTPAQFERYRQDQERLKSVSGLSKDKEEEDEEETYDDDEDDAEKAKEASQSQASSAMNCPELDPKPNDACWDNTNGSSRSAQDILEGEPRSPHSSHETDSTCSVDCTDWDEDSILDFDMSTFKDEAHIHSWAPETGDSAVDKKMTSVQIRLIRLLMHEFWKHFEKTLTVYAGHAGQGSVERPSVSTSSVSKQPPRKNLSRDRKSKRPRDEDGDDSGHDSRRNPKRGSCESQLSDSDMGLRYACPYRKRNPRKYSVQAWPRCALTPHKSVARVKGHLYTYHYIHQCQRCKNVFSSEAKLDDHVEALESCPSRTGVPVDGITSKVKARLQSRKKAHPDQTERDRWVQIYQILFEPKADETIPSPYVASFQSYLRRELPHFFRAVLETAVTRELHPIEERLRSELVDLMEEAQNNAFSSWRAMYESGVDPESLPSAPITFDSAGTLTQTALEVPQEARDQAGGMAPESVFGPLESISQPQSLRRTVSDTSNSGYNSDSAGLRTSEETSSAPSHEESDLLVQHSSSFEAPGLPNNHQVFFANAESRHLFFPNDVASDTLDREQDEGLQSRLMFKDDAWAVNFDNLDLEYSILDPSWSVGGSHNFPL
ncbi:uncharacterized protein PAC_19427 [Phialocephala subalpina]|uniref:C2H2-type domain-containing protein n=1 Tax=Phialocephala subalpina TaxID=576137 RepID=A0A1L7XWZ0_9HELO|nr:uncharacterized protein PAC_19427 [Phialocephala subalpina]